MFLVKSLGLSIYKIILFANTDNFTFSFWFECFFFVFPDYYKLPVLCWMRMVRIGTLVSFLILEGKLSIFHHWMWYNRWVCHMWPLLCWSMFLLYTVCWAILLWKNVYFVKCFFCHLWYLSFILVSHFFICNVKLPVHPRDKSSWTEYVPFNGC